MKTAVLIVAAGRGSRAPGHIPKQYRRLGNDMVLSKTIRCFTAYGGFGPIMVAINPADKPLFDEAIKYAAQDILWTPGGDSRTASVAHGLKALGNYDPDQILIHDGARPYLTGNVIDNVLKGLKTHKAVVPALPIVDALKSLDASPVNRDNIMRVQTPQGFRFNEIALLYGALAQSADFADDIEVAKAGGLDIKFCEGDERNIKLTYEYDFQNAAQTPSGNSSLTPITANGFDVHKICEGKSLFLCGVEIFAGFSLKGHSDADVALHAITDALLGTISAGDIGTHFPPSDMRWKNADSAKFLSHAANLVRSEGGIIDHIDITLICERPKIGMHREQMRTRMSQILHMDIARISLKATTTEGLGFTGRGEGIAAQASVSVRLPSV